MLFRLLESYEKCYRPYVKTIQKVMAVAVLINEMLIDGDGLAKKERYTCPSCRNILQDAVQLSCGHWMCNKCAEDLFTMAGKTGHTPVCLKEGCGEVLTKEDGTYFFPDRFVRKDIQKIMVRCMHHNRDCNWTGKYGELKDHLSKCAYHRFICSLCDAQLQEGDEKVHERVCPKAVRDCPLAYLGCTMKDKMTQSEVRDHVVDNIVDHFDMVARALKVLNREKSPNPIEPQHHLRPEHHSNGGDHGYVSLEPGGGDFDETDGAVGEDDDQIIVTVDKMREKGGRVAVDGDDSKDDSYDESDGEIKTLLPQPLYSQFFAEKGSRVEADGGDCIEEKKRLRNTQVVTRQPYYTEQRFMETVQQQITEKVLAQQLANLQQDMEKLLKAETRSQAKETSSVCAMCSKLERNVRSKNAEFEDSNFRLSLLENSNHDGTMIWKIPQISQRMADAENGKYTSIFSLPFHTGRYGYKMCMRLYILGDGIGKGSHMSLFFVLMKGEFDNILQWPFTHKVTFKLINQAGGRDVVDTFQPDPMSSSFRKPRSDMNIASGCPQFVSLHDLKNNGFIVDDVIVIKIIVDTKTLICSQTAQ